MGRLKVFYGMLDAFLIGIWGLTIIDLLVIVNIDSYDVIDDFAKTVLALAGVFYLLIIKIPNEYRMNKLKRKEKEEQIRKIKIENDKESKE